MLSGLLRRLCRNIKLVLWRLLPDRGPRHAGRGRILLVLLPPGRPHHLLRIQDRPLRGRVRTDRARRRGRVGRGVQPGQGEGAGNESHAHAIIIVCEADLYILMLLVS